MILVLFSSLLGFGCDGADDAANDERELCFRDANDLGFVNRLGECWWTSACEHGGLASSGDDDY